MLFLDETTYYRKGLFIEFYCHILYVIVLLGMLFLEKAYVEKPRNCSAQPNRTTKAIPLCAVNKKTKRYRPTE